MLVWAKTIAETTIATWETYNPCDDHDEDPLMFFICVFFVVVVMADLTCMAPESITDSMASTTAPFIMSPTILATSVSCLGKEYLQF